MYMLSSAPPYPQPQLAWVRWLIWLVQLILSCIPSYTQMMLFVASTYTPMNHIPCATSTTLTFLCTMPYMTSRSKWLSHMTHVTYIIHMTWMAILSSEPLCKQMLFFCQKFFNKSQFCQPCTIKNYNGISRLLALILGPIEFWGPIVTKIVSLNFSHFPIDYVSLLLSVCVCL